ncbi:MAG: hypothetical protein WCH58_01160 [Candidatus Saccharibacteria bacterium]
MSIYNRLPDTIINGIRIIEVLPIEILEERWLCVGFEQENENLGDSMHLLLIYSKNITLEKNILYQAMNIFKDKVPRIRVHSECILGDTFQSSLCDCGEQLQHSIASIRQSGLGAILYLRQEGRGIGLRAKLACLAIQEGYEQGQLTDLRMSPDEANLYYGYSVDEREYGLVPKVFNLFNIKSVELLTGNIEKINSIKNNGVNVVSINDISRSDIVIGTRKHKELEEKVKRNYMYMDLAK